LIPLPFAGAPQTISIVSKGCAATQKFLDERSVNIWTKRLDRIQMAVIRRDAAHWRRIIPV
jgi:hypothetical protein